MLTKYIVQLAKAEREVFQEVVKKRKGPGQEVRRAQVFLQADVNGPGCTDLRIAEAYRCRVQTEENIRRSFIERGWEVTLSGKQREHPPTAKVLDGKREAQVIATRLAIQGYASRTLKPLARKVVELAIVDSVS